MLKVSRGILTVILAALLFSGGVASAMPQYPETALTLGDFGGEVAALQAELTAAGLYGGDVTGLYDENTRAAVAALQTILGVRADGKFGAITYQAYLAALQAQLIVPVYPAAARPAAAEALAGRVIGIDPGHQQFADIALERISPASGLLKPRMSGGATGVKTGAEESLINLLIALKLQKLLADAGATVVMTRTSQDVSLSNADRASLMNQENVELWIRLHCDASTDANVSGACALIPSPSETPKTYEPSLALAEAVLNAFCAATGAKDLGITPLDSQTGFNWSKSPVISLEMGHLSNACDDVHLNRDAYQSVCAKGIFDGLAAYFAAQTVPAA
ncbi:MAG: N-acetylmuramoyl-L-alanine amidase [Eubacteriales bacterium]|nr:N-acetylmuramoyl-L-alanine amidase [Eubacteriales bacterium]